MNCSCRSTVTTKNSSQVVRLSCPEDEVSIIQKEKVKWRRTEGSWVDVRFLENFEEWIEYNFQYKGEIVHKKVVFFLGETRTEEVKISNEHLSYAWKEYNEAMEKTTFDNAKTILTKAQGLLSKTS